MLIEDVHIYHLTKDLKRPPDMGGGKGSQLRMQLHRSGKGRMGKSVAGQGDLEISPLIDALLMHLSAKSVTLGVTLRLVTGKIEDADEEWRTE